jgi:ferredoxin
VQERETIAIEIDGIVHDLRAGDSLQDLDGYSATNIVFGCYSGRCGICRIEVTEGLENLGPWNDLEDFMLGGSSESPSVRLACQCVPKGPVKLKSS